jgi:hypothetical protein
MNRMVAIIPKDIVVELFNGSILIENTETKNNKTFEIPVGVSVLLCEQNVMAIDGDNLPMDWNETLYQFGNEIISTMDDLTNLGILKEGI